MREASIDRLSAELAHTPGSTAFLHLADALRQKRSYLEARTIAERGLERHPYLPDAHDVLARICADSGDDERARDEWDMTLQLAPGHVGALKGLAYLAYRKGELWLAEQWLAEATRHAPNDSGVAAALQRVRDRAAGPTTLPPSSPERPGPRGESATLVIDRDGLPRQGALRVNGRDVTTALAAELTAVCDEAATTLAHLSLGAVQRVLLETEDATVAVAPHAGGFVAAIAPSEAPVGSVRALLTQAAQDASRWVEA